MVMAIDDGGGGGSYINNITLVQDRFSVRIEERPSEVVW
jgi:hypothetical protein